MGERMRRATDPTFVFELMCY